jgi:flagellar hook-basal body complex protein FliE
MSVDPIADFPQILQTAPQMTSASSGVGSFSERMRNELMAVNEQLVTAEGELQDLASGRQSNLHHVMLTMEEAKQSFQLLVQVRNKLLDSYQELMRMQV